MFDILPEINLVICAVFAVCAVFLTSNLIARASKKLVRPKYDGDDADLPVVVTEEQRRWNLAKIAAICGMRIVSDDEPVPMEVQLEAAIMRDELDGRRNTARTRQFYRDMRQALKENAARDAVELEIQRRLDHEVKRHQLGKGRRVHCFSRNHGWRSGQFVGFEKKRHSRGRAIIRLEGRPVLVRRTLDLVEVA